MYDICMYGVCHILTPQIFNERATPELSDWDRYAKIEYQRLAMEEDQGELGDEADWDPQVMEV